jgi:hypothetical protein
MLSFPRKRYKFNFASVLTVNFHCLPGDAETMTQCYRCQHDLRLAQAPPIGENTDYRHLVQFQTFLLRAMRRGNGRLWGFNGIPGAPFLTDLYQRMQFFLAKIHAPGFQEAFGEYLHPAFFASHLTSSTTLLLSDFATLNPVRIVYGYDRNPLLHIQPPTEQT